MVDPQKGKDIWDKMDVVGKLLSTIVLAVIALFLKAGTEQIAFSLQKGDLVQSLIVDLTNRDNSARKDVALIALDHSIGAEDPVMVSDIAERLFREIPDTVRISEERGSLGGFAFRIMRKRTPARARAIRDSLLAQASRSGLRSQPDTAQKSTAGPTNQARLLARAFDSLVYIQFRRESQRDEMEALRQHLISAGYNAPGVDRVNTNFTSGVRYFYREDRALADSVAALAERFLSRQESSFSLPRLDLSSQEYDAARGQVELWVDP